MSERDSPSLNPTPDPWNSVDGGLSLTTTKYRHPALLEARRLAHSDFTDTTIVREVVCYTTYRDYIANRVIILKNEDTGAYLKLPYVTRLNSTYRKKVKRKLWGLYHDVIKHYPRLRDNVLFVTLTASTKHFRSQADANQQIEKFWNRLATRLRRDYNAIAIKVKEWQKNGIGLHLHVAIFGVKFIPKSWFEKTWSKLEKSGWAIQLERVITRMGSKGVIAYLLKYLTKQFSDTEVDITNLVNWSLGVRSFSVIGLGLVTAKNNSNLSSVQKTESWRYIGTFPSSLFEGYDTSERIAERLAQLLQPKRIPPPKRRRRTGPVYFPIPIRRLRVKEPLDMLSGDYSDF